MSAPPTIADALRAATHRLATTGGSTPRLDAEVLLRHVLGLDRTGLFLRLGESLSTADIARFDELIDRRLAGEPVAYLTGEREFMGLPFAVGPEVLVPRPETELLVEWALSWLQARPDATVIDVGTGSGAIALSLATHLPKMWRGAIVASDSHAAALAKAAENRNRLDPIHRVDLVLGDLASWCGGPVDLLLGNLPYLRPEQIEDNPDLHAEPALALLGGRDGLESIRRLLADAPRLLAPDGALGLEIDPSQVTAVRAMAQTAFPRASVAVRPDLAGLARHVIVELGERSTRFLMSSPPRSK